MAVPDINDKNDTVKAMNIMGMPEEEQNGEIYKGLFSAYCRTEHCVKQIKNPI